jgi:hypothetical protein
MTPHLHWSFAVQIMLAVSFHVLNSKTIFLTVLALRLQTSLIFFVQMCVTSLVREKDADMTDPKGSTRGASGCVRLFAYMPHASRLT